MRRLKFLSTMHLLCRLLVLLLLGLGSGLTAQSSGPFYSAMRDNVTQLDTNLSQTTLIRLAANFERIGRVEREHWLPRYYSAFCYATIAYRERDLDKVDEWCDRATFALDEAAQLEHPPAEISIVRALIDYARIQVDFMGRGLERSDSALRHIKQAAETDPENPRAFALLAQHYFNIPPQMGGDREKGCRYGNRAAELFAASRERAADHYTIEPHWGEGDVQELLAKLCGGVKNSKK